MSTLSPFDAVIEALQRIRIVVARDEIADMHKAIELALAASGLQWQREVQLGQGMRLDFLVAGCVAIEAKRSRPNAVRVHRQLARYARSPRVSSIVLVVERAIPLAATIEGKRIGQVATQALWGVAV